MAEILSYFKIIFIATSIQKTDFIPFSVVDVSTTSTTDS